MWRASRLRRHRRGAARLASIVVLGLLAWSWRPAVVQHLGLADPLLSAGLSLVYGPTITPERVTPERVAVEGATPERGALSEPVEIGSRLRQLDPRFLSVALDTSQIVGGRWWSRSGAVEIGRGARRVAPFDVSRPELVQLARALAPAYLRVGGTEADHVYYALDASTAGAPPPGYELALTAPAWDALAGFAASSGLDLMFTLNAGPGPRSGGSAWRTDNAESLLRHVRSRGQRVAVWELGNEVNGYWFIHGLDQQVSGARYAADVALARQLVDTWSPGSRLAGPGSLFWPVVGEPLRPLFGMLQEFLARAEDAPVDIISWHFYPQQSRRCPVATRRASIEQLLEPSHLDELGRWANELVELRDRYAPSAEVWLGETGNAQCGGEPGVSDRFVASLWWLDELGLAARRGQAVVIRQTLAGSDYGLLDDATLEPRPDYFVSLLWKRLMGATVLDVQATSDPFLRLYAHCAAEPGAPGSAVLLAINLHPGRAAAFRVAGGVVPATAYRLSAPSLDSRHIELEGQTLSVSHGTLPELRGAPLNAEAADIQLAPASAAFYVLGAGSVPACGAESIR